MRCPTVIKLLLLFWCISAKSIRTVCRSSALISIESVLFCRKCWPIFGEAEYLWYFPALQQQDCLWALPPVHHHIMRIFQFCDFVTSRFCASVYLSICVGARRLSVPSVPSNFCSCLVWCCVCLPKCYGTFLSNAQHMLLPPV